MSVKPLEVFALDHDWNRASGSIPYTSLQWSRRYYEAGTFVMQVPSTIFDPDWEFIYCADRPETGIIQKVEYEDTDQSPANRDTVTISGYFLEWLMSNRVIEGNNPDGNTGFEKDVASRCTEIAKVTGGDSIHGLRLRYLDPTVKLESEYTYPDVENLDRFLWNTLQPCQASYRVTYDFVSNCAMFQVWKGLDRTYAQNVNSWAVFADYWGNLLNFKASDDISNCKNTCKIFVDLFEPDGWDEYGQPLMEQTWFGWYIPHHKADPFVTANVDDGMPRNETYIDARDRFPEGYTGSWCIFTVYDQDDTPTFREKDYENFYNSLKAEAVEMMLNDYNRVTNLETGDTDPKRYLEDYDLGDLVSFDISQLGISQTARIIGVDEVYEESGNTISLVIGDRLVTAYQKYRLLTH